jgi:hypothetical protein
MQERGRPMITQLSKSFEVPVCEDERASNCCANLGPNMLT